MSLIACTNKCSHQKEGVCALDVATKIDQSRADLECAYFSNGAMAYKGTGATPRVTPVQ